MYKLDDEALLREIDYYILNSLFTGFISWDISYCNLFILFNWIEQNFELNEEEDFDYIARIYYLHWLGYIDFEPILSTKDLYDRAKEFSIDIKWLLKWKWKDLCILKGNYYKKVLFWKISSNWIQKYEELKKQIESSKWIIWFLNKIKDSINYIYTRKIVIWTSLTVMLMFMIFVFDIKVSNFVSKIPLISSILDIDLLKSFEEVNINDEYFQELSQNFWVNMGNVVNNSWQIEDNQVIFKYLNDNVEKVVTPRLWEFEIKVKNVSDTEKIFRLKKDNWEVEYITIKKSEDGNFITTMPDKFSQELKKINNIINEQHR